MKTTDVEKLNPKQLLQLALMCSFTYYHRYYPLIEDEVFDRIMNRLLEEWDSFEHQHKHLFTKEDLKAGTAFKLKEKDYPTMVIDAAIRWADSKAIQGNFDRTS